MRHQSIILFAIASAFLTQSNGDAQFKGGKGGGKSGWLPTLQEGKLIARQTGKPIMVVLRCVP